MDALESGQYKQLRELFRNLDTDSDGVIFASELRDFLAAYNENFTLEEVQSFVDEHTIDKSGVVDFPQFVNMLSFLLSEQNDELELSEEELKFVFTSMDANRKGFLTGNDIRTVCKMIGENWSDSEINEMIYHRKADGRFYFEDFKAMIQPQYVAKKAALLAKLKRTNQREKLQQAAAALKNTSSSSPIKPTITKE